MGDNYYKPASWEPTLTVDQFVEAVRRMQPFFDRRCGAHAEDVASDFIVHALERKWHERYIGEPPTQERGHHVTAFVATYARAFVVSWWRHRAHRYRTTKAASLSDIVIRSKAPDPHRVAAAKDQVAQIARVLPIEQMTALRLVIGAGMTTRQAAETMNITPREILDMMREARERVARRVRADIS